MLLHITPLFLSLSLSLSVYERYYILHLSLFLFLSTFLSLSIWTRLFVRAFVRPDESIFHSFFFLSVCVLKNHLNVYVHVSTIKHLCKTDANQRTDISKRIDI